MSESGTRDVTESSNRQELCTTIINAATGITDGASGQNPTPKMITLKSCEGLEFKVPLAVTEQSGMIKAVVNEFAKYCILLPAVTTPVLEQIISFWTECPGSNKFIKECQQNVQNWEKKFFDKMNREQLFEFALAANYMDAKEMLDRTSCYIAEMIKDMSVEDVRDCFGIENDFTPEEEQHLREENKWVFEETKAK